MRNFNIIVDGKSYQVQVEETIAGAAAPAQAAPVAAPVAAPAPKAAASVAGGGEQVTSPMPGMIVDFKVANGQTVKEGDVVVVLEAMKMENDIVAPCGGVVTIVGTKGASVNTGDVLATIK